MMMNNLDIDDFPVDAETALVEDMTRKRIENSTSIEETSDAISDALVWTLVRQLNL